MDKEAVFKKLKFGNDGENLIVNAPEEYFGILAGAKFDTVPEDVKLGKYVLYRCLLRRRPRWKN